MQPSCSDLSQKDSERTVKWSWAGAEMEEKALKCDVRNSYKTTLCLQRRAKNTFFADKKKKGFTWLWFVFQKIPFIWRAHYVFGLWSILTLIFSTLKLQPNQGDDFHSSLTGSSSQGFPPPCQFNFEFNLCLWCAFHPFMLDVICQFNKYILHSIIQLLMKLMNNIGQRTHPSRAC